MLLGLVWLGASAPGLGVVMERWMDVSYWLLGLAEFPVWVLLGLLIVGGVSLVVLLWSP